MQVGLNSYSDKTNFGQLYIKCASGKNTRSSKLAEYVKPELEKMAEDVDIYVRFRELLNESIDVTVSDIVKSPLKRFLGRIGYNVKNSLMFCNMYESENIAEMLMNCVKKTKDEFKAFWNYNNA